MPRRLIGDAHEWVSEILSVFTHHSANLQPSERAWTCSAGKEDPIEFDSS